MYKSAEQLLATAWSVILLLWDKRPDERGQESGSAVGPPWTPHQTFPLHHPDFFVVRMFY